MNLSPDSVVRIVWALLLPTLLWKLRFRRIATVWELACLLRWLQVGVDLSRFPFHDSVKSRGQSCGGDQPAD